MAIALHSDENGDELTRTETLAVMKNVQNTIVGQLRTFPALPDGESPYVVLAKALGTVRLERLVKDIAANIVQGLL